MDKLIKEDIKSMMVFFFACYLQSFILSFHGWRQAISCLLNLMGTTFAQVGETTNTSTFVCIFIKFLYQLYLLYWFDLMSCLLNLMGASFAQVGSSGETTNTYSTFVSVLTRSTFNTNGCNRFTFVFFNRRSRTSQTTLGM